MAIVVIVSDKQDVAGLDGKIVAEADEYLAGDVANAYPDATVINLCREISYGSKGYYVSLLADARGQHVIPTVRTLSGLAEPFARFRALQDAGANTIDTGEMVRRRRAADEGNVQTIERGGRFPVPLIAQADGSYCAAKDDEYIETLIFMGICEDARFQKAARAVFSEWPAPLLRMQVVHEGEQWKIAQIAAAAPNELSDGQRRELVNALSAGGADDRVFRRNAARRETVRASIAVLVELADPFSPSTPETIDRFERVAAGMGVHVARITQNEMRRLPEYDALFVRTHTNVTHPAFQFALRAEALGMPVVDATQSTIRGTNKVYLEELLSRAGVPTPRAQIIAAATSWDQIEQLGLPFVLKRPDGDFSEAVHKITNRPEYERYAAELFARSPLLIAQEWLPTDYDWRIGVLGGELLFAARYYMASGHWQIRSVEKGNERYGRVEAIPRAEAPAAVVEVALRAARLIGNGLYGVDIKVGPNGPVVIEVNDNANLDTGYEDAADGDVIYEDIVRYFLDRIEAAPPERQDEPAQLEQIRKPIFAGRPRRSAHFKAFEVAGLELEYPVVDRELNVVSLVEPAFRLLAGRGASDVDLGAIGFSNEFADHVLELKTQQPVADMNEIEALLYEGVQRFNAVLRDEFDARLFPTAMHPWFDPLNARLWTRSDAQIYTTYARLFNVRTHGWMNVQASHLNLPFGTEAEAMAMLNASSLLVPYLPAVAASSPMYDGQLQTDVDSRLTFLTTIQARIPESCGAVVPEYVHSFADYKTGILQPMYEALDKLPDTSCIRYEFFNTRAAILRFSRRALEIRALDTQECVKMDVAIAVFVRWSLKHLTHLLLDGRIDLPSHGLLVRDFHATVRAGTRAQVQAPHVERASTAADVLKIMLDGARAHAPTKDMKYLDLVERVVESGSLGERIKARLQPYTEKSAQELKEAARQIYIELANCLDANEPWEGRWS